MDESPFQHTTLHNMSTLRDAAATGSVERAIDLLSDGSTDIDECSDYDGWTPLMIAAEEGYLRIVRVLLRHGSNVLASTDGGHTALHVSVHNGHLAVTKALVKAGADIEAEAACFTLGPEKIEGHTPLHLAAGEGLREITAALVGAGANVNCRLENGATPLYISACCGKLDVVKILIRAKADPLLSVGMNFPLDVAAQEGHLGVVRELVQWFGIEGCSNDEGGMEALHAAAFTNHVDVVNFLCDSGVVDTDGSAFCAAVEGRATDCAKLLVQRRGGHVGMDARAYVNIAKGRDNPIMATFDMGRCLAPRMARFLLDQGVDTTTHVKFHFEKLGVISDTPVVAAILALRQAETFSNIDQGVVDGLKGVIRVMHQLEAVRAVSWCWPSFADRPTEKKREKKSAAIGRMLPILKKRAKRPSVLLGALARYNNKQDGAFLGYEC